MIIVCKDFLQAFDILLKIYKIFHVKPEKYVKNLFNFIDRNVYQIEESTAKDQEIVTEIESFGEELENNSRKDSDSEHSEDI